MTERPAITAQRLMNLYRQAHVIVGGWSVVNPIFAADADESVIAEIKKLACGERLVAHIKNLQSGKTPMNYIEQELLPYGGAMHAKTDAAVTFSDEQLKEIESALNTFVPDEAHLSEIAGLGVVKEFGDDWMTGIGLALAARPDLAAKWKMVRQTSRAYDLWGVARTIVSKPISERDRARIQADLPEFETYLPMFGDTGKELMSKLRNMVSSV